MKKIYGIFLFIIFIYGCVSVNENDFFNGTIKIVTANNHTPIKIELEPIEIDAPLCDIYIHDTLIFSYNTNRDTQFDIINLKNGNTIGSFCNKGAAKNEFFSTTPLSHIYEENGDLKSIIIDPAKKNLYRWNVTKSIHEKSTIFDTIVDFRSLAEYRRPYDYVEYVDDTTIVTYTQSHVINRFDRQPKLPFIELRSLNDEKLYKDFFIFKSTFEEQSTEEDKGQIQSYRFYASRTSIRPDGCYIVQSMLRLGQINIINTSTGEIVGIRLAETPDFSQFLKPRNVISYYFCGGLWATNNRIYVGYCGEKERELCNVKYMYEFDWNGNVMNRYEFDTAVDEIIYDKSNKKFYCMTIADEKLYTFKI